jgi:integrase
VSKLPAGIDKLPRGVEIHGRQVRIAFTYMGRRCREPIDGVTKITKATIAYAERKRAVILTEIAEGRFSYAAHFPDSVKAALFSGYGGRVINRTIVEGVERWLQVKQVECSTSTYTNYVVKAKHVARWWPAKRIREVTKSDLMAFRSGLVSDSGLAPKTINDIFTVVRGVWGDAFADGVIDHNPCDRIINFKPDDESSFADPFGRDELERIAAVTGKPELVNMVLFASWCGLSVSELMGLAWEDIDTRHWQVHVRRARVEAEYKVPKERSRMRTVELIAPAVEWLKRQQQHTMMLPPQTISVKRRNNITAKDETVRFVFLNRQRDGYAPWSKETLARHAGDLLKKARVRHRGPNQCRHTFASQALSAYVPLEWVARQLGHSDTTMIKKHYGRWIPKDTKSMAPMVSEMMGFARSVAVSGGLENADSAPILPQAAGEKSGRAEKT